MLVEPGNRADGNFLDLTVVGDQAGDFLLDVGRLGVNRRGQACLCQCLDSGNEPLVAGRGIGSGGGVNAVGPVSLIEEAKLERGLLIHEDPGVFPFAKAPYGDGKTIHSSGRQGDVRRTYRGNI